MIWRWKTPGGRLFRMCPCGHAAGLHASERPGLCAADGCRCETSRRTVMRHGADPVPPGPQDAP